MIKFQNLTLSYDNKENIIDNLNLEINDNEFLVIVGPSGCGKTSLVKMLAGLIKPTSGSIYINDKVINDVEPYNRGISYMQQNSKVYPHMNVYNNISFGLEAKKMDKESIDLKVNEIAEMLSIKPYLKRKPSELSGGELQRVNLAKTLVLDNKIVIFDEPLSNIDAKLKADMRFDIKRLHNIKNNTTIYITHDQEEAMSLADRIVLMDKGQIIQVGTPIELLDKPINMFSANFIGKMNFIKDNDKYIGFRLTDVTLGGDLLVKVIGSEIVGDRKKIIGILDDNKIEFFVGLKDDIKDEEYISINKKYIFNLDKNLERIID
ncbi:MAG: ABC transporter ATP-binding protein [bacterium]|nr:ABC transporter ATP-binding protein [bacterium]